MKRAALLLSPLLVLYVWLTLDRAQDQLRKDEPTYVMYAANLRAGGYAPAGSECLWAGPGYPLLLAPILATDRVPFTSVSTRTAAKLVNALLLFCAVLMVRAAVARYTGPGVASGVALLFGLYWPIYDQLGFMMTEPLAVFLIAGLVLCGSGFLARGGWGRLLGTGASLGYLALTKVVFGYALAGGLVLAVMLGVVRRRRMWWRAAAALLLGLALCTPYLAYTYRITGRPFLWGTSGGMQLYWMSSPQQHEYGDWVNYVLEGMRDPSDRNPVMQHHAAVFREAMGYAPANFVAEGHDKLVLRLGAHQNQVFLDTALDNIRRHPFKFTSNWVANVSRLLTGAPRSYHPQTPEMVRYLFPNLLLVAWAAFAAARRPLRAMPGEAWAIGGFGLVYLGGVSLLSCYPRFLTILGPILFWWPAVVGSNRTDSGSQGVAQRSTDT
ncbi:MAG: hypothetical protein H6837_03930 [Planctomycetes bacterium]|nr:hypothetical protein [Planctomycetota bacterium]